MNGLTTELGLVPARQEVTQTPANRLDLRDSKWRVLGPNLWACGRLASPGVVVVSGPRQDAVEHSIQIYLDPPEGSPEAKKLGGPVRKLLRVSSGKIFIGDTAEGTYDQLSNQAFQPAVTQQTYMGCLPDIARATKLVNSITGPEAQEKAGDDFRDPIAATRDRWQDAVNAVTPPLPK